MDGRFNHGHHKQASETKQGKEVTQNGGGAGGAKEKPSPPVLTWRRVVRWRQKEGKLYKGEEQTNHQNKNKKSERPTWGRGLRCALFLLFVSFPLCPGGLPGVRVGLFSSPSPFPLSRRWLSARPSPVVVVVVAAAAAAAAGGGGGGGGAVVVVLCRRPSPSWCVARPGCHLARCAID
jgi:hypothetical protein